MAPEQARARHDEVGAKSDLWAVGATVFSLLTGRLVHFDAKSSTELLTFAACRPAPRLQSILPEAPTELAAWVDRALAFDQRDRWPNAKAMRDALRPLLEAAVRRELNQVPHDSTKLGFACLAERLSGLRQWLASVIRRASDRRSSNASLGLTLPFSR